MSAKVVPLDLDIENRGYAERMAKVFTGNQSAHYTADFRNVTIETGGKRVPQYKAVQRAPTVAEFLAHLQGDRGPRIGLLVIPITKAGACRWGKIDVDVYGGDRLAQAHKYAKAIARHSLPLVVELTKSGGVHLAHYSPVNLSATDMRDKLIAWAAILKCPTNVEIFPKQEKLADGEPGSGINLPYFGGDSDSTLNYAVGPEGHRMSVARWLDIIENMKAEPSYTPGEVDVTGAADLLSRHWTDGQRDNLNIAVAGTLLRAGIETDKVQEILDGSSDIVADGATRKTALQIEQALDADKPVPGFKVLSSIIGTDDARELMRLVGGKPPPELIPFGFETASSDWHAVEPPPLTYTIEPLLPTGVVGLLVAEGGTGKTVFALRMAVSVAGGRELFGMPTKQGRVVYIACEEHPTSLRRRYHWIVKNEVRRMREAGSSQEDIDNFLSMLDANITIKSAVGYELHLVIVHAGQTKQGAVVDALIEKLPRPLELLVMDPISRLNGAEENSNSVGTALINAAERIAREVQTTVLLAHHTGKSAAKDRDTGLYAARGASGFVDAARSSIRLLQADANDVKSFNNVPDGVVAAGDLVQVIHNKSNEGPRAKPFWLRRQKLDFERFEPKSDGGVQRQQGLLNAIFAWYVSNGHKPFSKRQFREETLRETVFGRKVGRDTAWDLIDAAIYSGDLVKSPDKKAEKQLSFREGFSAM